MTKKRYPYIAANTVATFGYFSITLQWLWACIIVGYPLFTANHLEVFLPKPSVQTPAPQIIDYGGFGPVIAGIAIVFTIVVIALTVYALVKLPRQIGKKGQSVTHHAATALVPIVSRHQTTKKQRSLLSYRLTWWIKSALILLPLISLLAASPDTGLDQRIIVYVGIFLAACSGCYFAVQRLLQIAYRLAPKQLW